MYDPDNVSSSWCKLIRKSDALVVVEDQISSYKVAPYMHSLALLGTNLSEAKVAEIKEGKYKKIFLCLDNDATMAAIKASIKWRHVLPQLQIVGLPKDIKNMNEREFETFLEKLV